MSCTFVPPYLLQRIAMRAGTAMHLPPVGRRCRSMTACEPDGIATGSWPPHLPGPKPGGALPATPSRCREAVRSDGDPPVGDLAVDEAFDSSGQVWDMFDSQFGRRSIDGRGGTVSITVHYGRDYDNAFWDGTQLVFGDRGWADL